MKDIRRVFEYHGAEHKAVHCFEHDEKLTENAAKYTTTSTLWYQFYDVGDFISIIIFQ